MRTVLITLIGPERTSDLVVDADTAVAELLPNLLNAGGVADEAQRLPGWGLAVMGKQPIQPDQTLEDSGILDGTVVVLRREAEQRADPVLSSPLAGGLTGSPLERTRALLDQPSGATSLRGRLVPQIPDASAAAEGPRAALEDAIGAARLTRCATIAVVSPKGGVGKTTISILLGELMSSLRPETVLALDADVDYGSLGRVAPARAGASTLEARDSAVFDALAHGAVTFAELDRTLWKLPGGLRVVPSPRDPAQMAIVSNITVSSSRSRCMRFRRPGTRRPSGGRFGGSTRRGSTGPPGSREVAAPPGAAGAGAAGAACYGGGDDRRER